MQTKEKVNKAEIEIITSNDNGVFRTDPTIKRKNKNVLAYEKCSLVHHGIEETLSLDISPRFQGWTYSDYAEEFRFNKSVRHLEPMSAFEDVEYLIEDELLDNEIAELKYDGHRGTLYIGEEFNRNFSRNIGKTTGWYGEGTDQVPHIRELSLPEFEGTILDGEFDYGTNSNKVQSVMGAKPENAIQFQLENGLIKYFAFDILYYKGINVQAMPLWKRKVYLMQVIKGFNDRYGNCNVEFAKIYAHSRAVARLGKLWKDYCNDFEFEDLLSENVSIIDSYVAEFHRVVELGLEGLIVKDINARYEQKRSKAFIKLKDTETWDCVMMGLTESTKIYTGKGLDTWEYWETPQGKLVLNDVGEIGSSLVAKGFTPITKPFYMGWCGGISFGVWKELSEDGYEYIIGNGHDDQMMDEGLGKWIDSKFYELIQVGDCKGISDKNLIDLKKNGQKYINEQRVIEVKANGILDKKKGSLRHPRFHMYRDDKSSEQCDFKSHIREL